jgi:hypothetical protein
MSKISGQVFGKLVQLTQIVLPQEANELVVNTRLASKLVFRL